MTTTNSGTDNTSAHGANMIGSNNPTLLATYQNSECIIITKSQFETNISNALSDAYQYRASENHLYPVYSLINSQSCATLTHPRYPDATIAYSAQPLFGTRKSPEDGAEPPEAGDIPNSQIPDYARILLYGTEKMQDGDVRDLIDAWEIKQHNCACPWDEPDAAKDAVSSTPFHVLQVYDQAMTAFSHNPGWQRVYALLIIGAYFSQFVWKRPAVLPTRAPAPVTPVPGPINDENAYNKEIREAQEMIKLVKARPLPEVKRYGVPVFDFHRDAEGATLTASLSSRFIHAMTLPLQHSPGVKQQPSWFVPPKNVPKADKTSLSQGKVACKAAIHLNPIAKLKEQIDALTSKTRRLNIGDNPTVGEDDVLPVNVMYPSPATPDPSPDWNGAKGMKAKADLDQADESPLANRTSNRTKAPPQFRNAVPITVEEQLKIREKREREKREHEKREREKREREEKEEVHEDKERKEKEREEKEREGKGYKGKGHIGKDRGN